MESAPKPCSILLGKVLRPANYTQPPTGITCTTNLSGDPSTQTGGCQRPPSGPFQAWAGEPGNKDTLTRVPGTPQRWCCTNQLGARTPYDSGRPRTPPIGRSAQLRKFMDNMIDRSDTRGFIKQNLQYPDYTVSCFVENPDQVSKTKGMFNERCPDFRPTGVKPLPAEEDLLNAELDEVIVAMNRTSDKRERLFTELTKTEEATHFAKEDMHRLPVNSDKTPLLRKIEELNASQRGLLCQISSLNSELRELIARKRRLELKVARLPIERQQRELQQRRPQSRGVTWG